MEKNEKTEYYFLIVDDLESQRVALETAIADVVPRREFIKVGTFTEARKIVTEKTEPIDLAVVDLRLEKSDEEGIELVNMLKSLPHRKRAKAILITAYPHNTNRVLAKKAGADAYISKLDASWTKELQDTVLKLLAL
jgi:ActR/RegA family two-component response regulator